MFAHEFPFDPAYGYSLDDLLRVPAPLAPADFAEFWQKRFEGIKALQPKLTLGTKKTLASGWVSQPVSYPSTDGWTIQGWLLTPAEEPIERGIVSLHGYGGLGEPEGSLQLDRTAILFPGLRGLPPTLRPGYPNNSAEHVVFKIEDRDQYIIGGCVEDTWLAVTALLNEFPHIAWRVGLIGGSFGGGIGALTLPWDERIQRAHLKVPTFGNQPLRLLLPCNGSGNAVTQYFKRTGKIPPSLAYYDAATAASFIRIPMHVAPALFDPAVPPPGQFAVYNAIPGKKELCIATAGHFAHENEAAEEQVRLRQVAKFFEGL